MKRSDYVGKHEVVYIEFERGWGNRIDDQSFFDLKEDALAEVERFNSSNTEITVPDWYMVAEYKGIVN